MHKRNYYEEFVTLKYDVINDIKRLLKKNDGVVNIPYLTNIDFEYEVLKKYNEKGYDFRLTDKDDYRNFVMAVEVDCEVKYVEIIRAFIGFANEVEFVDSEMNVWNLGDVFDFYHIIDLHDLIYDIATNK